MPGADGEGAAAAEGSEQVRDAPLAAKTPDTTADAADVASELTPSASSPLAQLNSPESNKRMLVALEALEFEELQEAAKYFEQTSKPGHHLLPRKEHERIFLERAVAEGREAAARRFLVTLHQMAHAASGEGGGGAARSTQRRTAERPIRKGAHAMGSAADGKPVPATDPGTKSGPHKAAAAAADVAAAAAAATARRRRRRSSRCRRRTRTSGPRRRRAAARRGGLVTVSGRKSPRNGAATVAAASGLPRWRRRQCRWRRRERRGASAG